MACHKRFHEKVPPINPLWNPWNLFSKRLTRGSLRSPRGSLLVAYLLLATGPARPWDEE
jgi:hypothetical protein